MPEQRACRECNLVIEDDEIEHCPNCNSSGLSNDISGVVIISNPEKSAIAERMKIETAGKYALKVR